MTNKNKYLFKKQDKVLKYSDIVDGMSKKQVKQFEKNDYTLKLDVNRYYKLVFSQPIEYLNSLIIDESVILEKKLFIQECNAKNIYIENQKKLGDITIPYEYFIKNNLIISFIWEKIKSNIKKINIIMNDDSVINIDTMLAKSIEILKDGNSLKVVIGNDNSLICYKINSLGKVDKDYFKYTITKEDIIDNTLDLRKYNHYKQIHFDHIELDRLIINKEIIKNIWKYKEMFLKLKIKTLDIIDDNPMKLVPTNQIVDIDKKDIITRTKNDYYGNMIIIKDNDGVSIIYLDKEDNIILLDKDYLIKKYDINNAKLIIENIYFLSDTYFMILIKDNNSKYKVIIEDKEYVLTETFKYFLLLNKDLYVADEIVEDIKNNNWFNIIGKYNFNANGFLNKYKDYLKYKERLEKLKELGFSYNALKYMYDKHIDTIINTQTEDNLIDINELEDYEIKAFNDLGNEYIKRKRLKK